MKKMYLLSIIIVTFILTSCSLTASNDRVVNSKNNTSSINTYVKNSDNKVTSDSKSTDATSTDASKPTTSGSNDVTNKKNTNSTPVVSSQSVNRTSSTVHHTASTENTTSGSNVSTNVIQHSITKDNSNQLLPAQNTKPPVTGTITNPQPVVNQVLIQENGLTVSFANGAFLLSGILPNDPVLNKGLDMVVDFGYMGKSTGNLPLTSKYINANVTVDQLPNAQVTITISDNYYLDSTKTSTGVATLVNKTVSLPSSVTNNYLSSSNYVQSDNPAIINLAKQITAGLTTDLQKSAAIHRWVSTNVSYDVANYFAGTIKTYSALDTLNTKIAMCTGYANLSAALHRAVGIPARIAVGTVDGGGHAWNEIEINGHWVFEDPTFDSGYIDASTNQFVHSYSTAYFNVPTPSSHHLLGYANY